MSEREIFVANLSLGDALSSAHADTTFHVSFTPACLFDQISIVLKWNPLLSSVLDQIIFLFLHFLILRPTNGFQSFALLLPLRDGRHSFSCHSALILCKFFGVSNPLVRDTSFTKEWLSCSAGFCVMVRWLFGSLQNAFGCCSASAVPFS